MRYEYVYGENIEKEYPAINMSIERITPKIAEEMLKTNVKNRNWKRESIQHGIESDQWKLNGETIVFSYDGILLDGQHRLMACVKSGKPIVTVVIRGIDPLAQLTMDQGVRRTLADYLKLAEYENYTHVSTIGTGLYVADAYGLEEAVYSNKIRSQYTLTDTYKFCVENYDSRIKPILPYAKRISRKYVGVSERTVGIALDAFRSVNEEDMIAFAEQILGTRQRCSAVQVLDNTLIKNANDKQGKLNHRTILAYIIKSWNAFMTGNDIKVLSFRAGGARPEQFPRVETDIG